MTPITERIITHFTDHRLPRITLLSKGKPVSDSKPDGLPKGLEPVSVAQVRESKGYRVKRYRQLAKCIAELGFFNQHFNLLYRGQDKDYVDKNKRSKVYPTFFRPEKNKVTASLIRKRAGDLTNYLKELRKNQTQFSFHKGLSGYREYYYSLVQHYQIYPSPLIDLTQSLRVAATFALQNRSEGYVLVFGMPHPHGSISHFVDQEMTLVKLQNVCPPTALRPHYQEGYLVGKLPTVLSKKEAGDNLARRLIGKYMLDNSDGGFWDKGFEPIPNEALFPPKDPFNDQLIAIRKTELSPKSNNE
jgi:hypothetical protein